MKEGYNLADLSMSNSNKFDHLYASVGSINRICIFLSHIQEDKKHVIEIGNYIRKAGFNIYLDVYDSKLRQAAEEGNHEAITKCLETGMKFSTHSMCIISEQTIKKRSWWVPYEIGYGRRNDNKISALLLKGYDKSNIPSYLHITDIIYGIKSLNKYLTQVYKENCGVLELYFKQDPPNIVDDNDKSHPLKDYLD